jgi:flagellar basal-body rod protein FlgB
MLPSLFDSTPIPLLEQVVNFTESRHGVLAGNIANLDTPGYRTRDLSPELFQQRLKDAVESRRSGPAANDGYGTYGNYGPVSKSDMYVGSGKYEPLHEVADSVKGMLRHDENNVGLEKQINQMVKNQVEHNVAVSVMSAQFRLLRAAITERVV